MLVHGTFARTETWWQPRPEYNFHAYIKFEVRPDLYSAPDRFEWTGGYSDRDREDGAQSLAAWAVQRQEQGIALFGHSHGANVTLRATHYGLRNEKLVLLSCPVHLPKYEPLWANVNDVVSVRVKADLVIMLDGGGQRFRHPRIRENVLSLWFNHSATHEPDVWRSHGVPSMI
jgi:pimeloyl-ACP methyl ester carboxylesterase